MFVSLLCCVQGEMDLGELEEELETEDEEEKQIEGEEVKVNEQAGQQHQLAYQPAMDESQQVSEADVAKEGSVSKQTKAANKIEVRLVEPTEPAEDVTQSAEPVGEREEVVSIAQEEQTGAVNEVGVEPLPEGVDDLYERQRREPLQLWEQQQAEREQERVKQEAEQQHKQHQKELKEIVRHAMTAIHK